MPIIEGKVLEGSTIYSDGWKVYDGLILNGYEHYRVYHSHNEFAREKVILTVSNLFGLLRKGVWRSSMA